jgi:hypothetical protein
MTGIEEIPIFSHLPDGRGKGEGDNTMKLNDFNFHYPSSLPSPPRGEGVS